VQHLERRPVEVEAPAAALAPGDDEPRVLEDGEVLHHGDAADGELRGDLPHRRARLGDQVVHHPAAPVVRQGAEDPVQLAGVEHVTI
jgi:hypothetical protein